MTEENPPKRLPFETANEEWDRRSQVHCPYDDALMNIHSGQGEIVFICPVCGNKEEMT